LVSVWFTYLVFISIAAFIALSTPTCQVSQAR
jgi:hypothetical protein